MMNVMVNVLIWEMRMPLETETDGQQDSDGGIVEVSDDYGEDDGDQKHTESDKW